jgi:hypothetical protein
MFGQSHIDRPKYLNFEPNFTWSKSNEIAMHFGRVEHLLLDEYPVASWGPFVGVGATYGGDNNAFVSKLGYAHSKGFFGGRAQILNYTDFRSAQFAVRPEIGLSFASWLNLFYGYTINLESGKNLIQSGHTLSISLSLSTYIIRSDQKKQVD